MPEVGGFALFPVFADSALHRTGTGIIGGQGQRPVAVEQLAQVLQIFQRGLGGGVNITSSIVPPVLIEPVQAAG